MNKLFTIFVIVLVVGIVGCQSMADTPEREVSSATTMQDVVNAWDANCDTYNFYSCPIDVAQYSCKENMASMYYGSNFATDSDGLLDAMATDLMILDDPDCNDNDLLNMVIEDSIWY